MKFLSLTRLTTLAAACAALSLASGSAVASPITIFNADFENSTAIDDDSGVTPNATVANLNAGTSVGSWALTNTGGPPGGIVSNADRTNNAFLMDQGDGWTTNVTSNDWATGLFTQSVNIAGGETMTLSFDMYASRHAGGQDRNLAIELQNSDGTTAYMIALRLGADGDAGKRVLRMMDTSGNWHDLGSMTGADIVNPDVDSYQTWDFADGASHHIRIDVLGQETATGNVGALVSVDWNSNGTFEILNAAIGPRNVGVGSIDRFELTHRNQGARGAYFDNFHATYIPEPASLVLLVVGAGLIGMRTRRRGA